jgi:hypothetical protein
MPIPNSLDFALSDVVTEIDPAMSPRSLTNCFALADPDKFDLRHCGDKDRLSNFKNYGWGGILTHVDTHDDGDVYRGLSSVGPYTFVALGSSGIAAYAHTEYGYLSLSGTIMPVEGGVCHDVWATIDGPYYFVYAVSYNSVYNWVTSFRMQESGQLVQVDYVRWSVNEWHNLNYAWRIDGDNAYNPGLPRNSKLLVACFTDVTHGGTVADLVNIEYDNAGNIDIDGRATPIPSVIMYQNVLFLPTANCWAVVVISSSGYSYLYTLGHNYECSLIDSESLPAFSSGVDLTSDFNNLIFVLSRDVTYDSASVSSVAVDEDGYLTNNYAYSIPELAASGGITYNNGFVMIITGSTITTETGNHIQSYRITEIGSLIWVRETTIYGGNLGCRLDTVSDEVIAVSLLNSGIMSYHFD